MKTVELEIYCDEIHKRYLHQDHTHWMYIGMLFVPLNVKAKLLNNLLNMRCIQHESWVWDESQCPYKCGFHDKNSTEIHYSTIHRTNARYRIGLRWLHDFLIEKNNKKDRGLVFFNIYVSLRLSQKPKVKLEEGELEKVLEEKRILKEEYRREQVFDADSVTQKFRKAVIVGGPGSGKTTLLKHLTLKSCKENLETQKRVTLPIFITLRKYSESGKDLREYMNEVFEQYEFPEAKDFIEKDLKTGRCQLFFDGFDELASREKQKTVTEGIETFIKKYPGNQVIVTSRTAGYHGELRGFERLEVLPFNDDQITQFVANWFRENNPEKAQSMGEAIRENEKIKDLARNPLMIAIIAIIYEEGQQLPQRRAKLYERCVDVLLSKWDVQRKIKNKYDAEAKQKILRKVALEFHLNEKRSFTKEELLKRFSEYLPAVRIKKEKAGDVLNEIVKTDVGKGLQSCNTLVNSN